MRRIFAMAVGGMGLSSITAQFTEEGVPAFTSRIPVTDDEGRQLLTRTGRLRWKAPPGEPYGSAAWNAGYIYTVLTGRAAAGEIETDDGTKIAVPAAVSAEEWETAQGALHGRWRKPGRVNRSHANLFQHLLRSATSGSAYHVGQRVGSAAKRYVSARARNGLGSEESFPVDTLEAAILHHLHEVDVRQILRQEAPDETTGLSTRLKQVQSQRAELEAELLGCEAPPRSAVRVLGQLEAQEMELEKQLREARGRAKGPLGEAWGQARGLLDVIRRDPKARLRLKGLLRKIVESILLVVARRGNDRLAAAQLWFTGGEHREYLILHRPPLCVPGRPSRPGLWRSRSLSQSSVDLRDREQAEALQQELAEFDLKSLL